MIKIGAILIIGKLLILVFLYKSRLIIIKKYKVVYYLNQNNELEKSISCCG
ncbi:hypothetical protein PROVRETT_08004 [Providencia rettgeri DSM 1131]|nr:hypothetical protein PROVRETT_08004 [Providencia rettgeri DSM 1131]